jgi:hypothetical protein
MQRAAPTFLPSAVSADTRSAAAQRVSDTLGAWKAAS